MTGGLDLIHGRLTRHLTIWPVAHHGSEALFGQIGNVLWGDLGRNGQRLG